MTHLRQIMLEELERRNYAPGTIRCYIRTVEHYSRHFHCSPDRLGPEHIRQYQALMFRKWKLAPNTVAQRLAALRFFYIQVLKRSWSVAETPYPKKILHLPQVLSQQEVARLIDAALTPFHRILLMTLYATGGRRAEVAQLKISDVDSQRMVIHIRGGKGRKDRDVMLSPALLDAPRVHWRGLDRKPSHWLFPGGVRHTAKRPIDTKVLWWACRHAAKRAGLEHKHIHPHTCGIALPLICWKPVPICAPFRCCSGTAIWKRRRSICISHNGTSAQPPVRWTPSRLADKENRRRAHEPASLGGGRYRSLGRTVVPRTESALDQLATPEGSAGDHALSHRCARRSSRPLFRLRTHCRLVQLMS